MYGGMILSKLAAGIGTFFIILTMLYVVFAGVWVIGSTLYYLAQSIMLLYSRYFHHVDVISSTLPCMGG